jgi:hypothetical protein
VRPLTDRGLIAAVLAAALVPGVGVAYATTSGRGALTGCLPAGYRMARLIEPRRSRRALLDDCASNELRGARKQTPIASGRRGSGDERFVTNIVRRSFADQLGQQAELVGDSVRVDSFQCSYAYMWRGATYFTCEASVGIKPADASADAECVYWLLVVDGHKTVSWRIQTPETCDSQALMEC